MVSDPYSFLCSLARHAVVRAAAQAPPVTLTLGGNLFVVRGPGVTAQTPVEVVLRTFGGTNDRTNPSSRINVQLAARSKSNALAWQMVQATFEASVLDAIGCEARMVQMPAYADANAATAAAGHWMLVAAETINRPGQVGRDDADVVSVVANFSVGFFRVD